jgi:hypothetical protein
MLEKKKKKKRRNLASVFIAFCTGKADQRVRVDFLAAGLAE